MKISLSRLAFCGLAALATLQAEVRLPAIISDHMVLQAGEAAEIWGWAAPGEAVTVSIAGQTKNATADDHGKWKVKLDKLEASSQPQTLTVAGTNTITVNDVLVGEVWLASGQSNMALRVQGTKDWEKEVAATNYPSIRMFTVRSDGSPTVQENCTGTWQVTTPQVVPLYAATAYYFGKELHRQMGVPVGLINSSVGGTRIEAWTSAEAQRAEPALKERVAEYDKEAATFNPATATAKYEKDLAAWKVQSEKLKAEGKEPPRAPMEPLAARNKQGRGLGLLFNAKIAPIVPYTIRGAIWYQGEANSPPDRVALYEKQLPVLIKDWRTRWGYDFPFAWVQLTNFEGGEGRDWPTIREGMLKNLSIPNTGMAITIDIGDADNIHALNKPEVGRRLALWALGSVYGKSGATSGPLPAGHKVRGSEMVVSFSHADDGLVAKGGELKGFLIAGADQQWKPAQARIEDDTVLISSPEVKAPAAVRYAWSNNPDCNLFNGAGLPATPFRTDDWKNPVVASATSSLADEGGADGDAAPAKAPANAAPVQASAPAEGNNVLQNGDFSQPVNQSRKRGEWNVFMAAEPGSSSPWVLAPSGYSIVSNTLELDMGQLNPTGMAKSNAASMNQTIPPLVPGKRYQFSFEAKADGAGSRLLFAVGIPASGLGEMAGGLSQQKIELGPEFQRYTYDFTAQAPAAGSADPNKFTRVDLRLGEVLGKLTLRDFRLIELD